jgi:UDP-hydrolysing UDP-N-acetyl-D-glucosamine 2-epimerase
VAKRKIAVVTSSRADYAHLRWLLHDLERSGKPEVQLIALGPHLSPVFGHTAQQIEQQVTQIECLLDSDTDVGMAKTIAVATLGLADVLGKMRPDILLIIADRYEMLAPAAVALALRIPIAHIEGGEITVGAIDDTVRNALMKMSHLHFACTEQAAERIAQMGEEPWRITFSGSLSLDALRRERLLTRQQLEKKLGVSLATDSVVCIYHPVTMMQNTISEAAEVFAAIEALKQQLIFIFPNADAGARELIRRVEKSLAKRPDSRIFVNLDHRTYLSLLKHAGVLVGNSSSGIIESTSLEVPAVNIGIRQRGREHAANVIDVPAKKDTIVVAVRRALTPGFRASIRKLKSPYGEGHAATAVARVLLNTPLGPKLLFKHADLL